MYGDGMGANRRRFGRFDGARLDLVVAGLILVESEVQIWVGNRTGDRAYTSVVAVILASSVALRRRFPLHVVAVIASTMVFRMLFIRSGNVQSLAGIQIGIILVFYGLGSFAPPSRSRWVLPIAAVVFGLSSWDKPDGAAGAAVATVVLAALVPYGLGLALRSRSTAEHRHRRQAERLDVERSVGAESAAYDERIRIARELHDVVAHSLSVMVIQAGGARLVMDDDPVRADRSLQIVESSGRQALTEMQRLIGMLGDGPDRPSLNHVGPLLEQARALGLRADLHVEGTPRPVSAAVDLCAYRIVQEALNNVVKHAGPTCAEVLVRWGPETLDVEVVDSGRGAGGPANRAGGGHGIVGMRERAAMFGGTLEAGPRASGGFAVRARIPMRQDLSV
jgi:signal transduction histidine kinase